MFARTFTSRARRRGVVLIVVLGMLGLLAIIGFTFATFSNQSQINAKNFMFASAFPDSGEMMDYALAQLIDDSYNPQSVIRGHSLKRDMYGNDASTNGFIPSGTLGSDNPQTPIHFTNVVASTTYPGYLQCTTNIATTDPRFYQYDFRGWILKFDSVSPAAINLGLGGPAAAPTFVVSESHEIFAQEPNSGAIALIILPPFANPKNLTRVKGFSATYIDTSKIPPTQIVNQSTLPSQGQAFPSGIMTRRTFSLDGRFRNGFNGAGVSSLGTDLGFPVGGPYTLPPRTKAEYGNYRYNGNVLTGTSYFPALGNPDLVGMDEDYDACDLENWFLAIQSADGQVMIPSFHRPGIVSTNPDRVNFPNDNDWTRTFPLNPTPSNLDQQLKGIRAMSRILRPRAVDRHSSVSFPDLLPDPTGKITYDIDNDGDGSTDSVWLDLGYPSKRNPEGQLFKPLFAFMVIGLNGRLPLNTAGNLNGRGPTSKPTFDHADHLGNSPSEIDLRFALQNAYDATAPLNYTQFDDARANMTAFYQGLGGTGGSPGLGFPTNDPTLGGISVALTQLRNLLCGTRPYDASDPLKNGDNNFVNVGPGVQMRLPNGIGDSQDAYPPNGYFGSPASLYVSRTTPPVAGRWGEEDAVPGLTPNYPLLTYGGVPSPLIGPPVGQPGPIYFYTDYNNFIRAGHSIVLNDPSQQLGGPPLTYDSRDDNYNTFDMWPSVLNAENEDLYDNAGGLLLPSERIRRFVTPIDTSGDGQVVTWTYNGNGNRPKNDGADPYGRVNFFHYFRPPGVPLNTWYNIPSTTSGTGNYPHDDVIGTFIAKDNGAKVNYLPVITANTQIPVMPGNAPIICPWPNSLTWPEPANNKYHGFTSFLTPDVKGLGKVPARGLFYGAMPFDGGLAVNSLLDLTAPATTFPTFSPIINSKAVNLPQALNNPVSYGMNEADEMDLYTPNRFDAAFGPSDLEWLYRSQDVDGSSLQSRLAYLAPVSFTNQRDGYRRRRLFALDSWDQNTYSYANDNPNGAFPRNSRYNPANTQFDPRFNTNLNSLSSASLYYSQGVPTPAIAHGGHRINLNFPLPVSNSAAEPVRQKWIRETYTFLKAILPPKSIDTPEELAQLSQYVVNIIDFRDPDCAMTKFVNTDIIVTQPTATTQATMAINPSTPAIPYDVSIQASNHITIAPKVTDYLIQYGMEYPPVAINEVLAFNFYTGITKVTSGAQATATPTNFRPQMYFELVNTLSKDKIPQPSLTNDSSDLDLTGWDVVVTKDDGTGRPDPFTGQVPPPPTGTALTSWLFNGTKLDAAFPPPSPPAYYPPPNTGATPLVPALNPQANNAGNEGLGAGFTNYYYVFGNDGFAGLTQNTNWTGLNATAYPSRTVGSNPIDIATYLDGIAAPSTNNYYWLSIRRPPNPFDTVYDPNKPNDNRVVVDSFRFCYTKGNGLAFTAPGNPEVDTQYTFVPTDQMFSLERMQPYRGGHQVAPLAGIYTGNDPTFCLTAYGYSEQTSASSDGSKNFKGLYKFVGGVDTTTVVRHTLGARNSRRDNSWDYLPFNDRDFTSVVELLTVPATSPGLFTKQFGETPPPISNLPSTPTTLPVAQATWPKPVVFQGQGEPHSTPYLNDEFFYTGANESTWPHAGPPVNAGPFAQVLNGVNPPYPVYQSANGNSINGPSGAGWHKMLEVFDVPSMSLKAIGPVAQGANYDWMRQDLRAGQLNLNLIVDEEVFLGLMGTSVYGKVFKNLLLPPDLNMGALNSVQLPVQDPSLVDRLKVPQIVNFVDDNGSPIPYKVSAAGNPSYPQMNNVGIFDTYYDPADGINKSYNRMKACFSDFLKLRHGGSGFLFAWGSGATGQNGNFNIRGNPTTPVALERPFRSLSFPDINYTILRPATLPPSDYTVPTTTRTASGVPINYPDFFTGQFPAGFPVYPYPASPPSPNVGSTPYFPTGPGFYTQDPGVKNPYIFTRTDPIQPQPIPPRRLFQVPDYFGYDNPLDANANFVPRSGITPEDPPSNASSAYNVTGYVPGPPSKYFATGDPAVNNQTLAPALYRAVTDLTTLPTFATATQTPGTVYLGGGSVYPGLGPPPNTLPDQRDHPYFRTEWLQKVANLTTPRTHQFAVWITVGFFEVTSQGNPALASSNNPAVAAKAYDLFGLELRKLEGKNIRYRSFFLLDRTKATGFNPTQPGDFRNVVVYRQLIE